MSCSCGNVETRAAAGGVDRWENGSPACDGAGARLGLARSVEGIQADLELRDVAVHLLQGYKSGRWPPANPCDSTFFERVGADDARFPGKLGRDKFGPDPIFNGTKRAIVARNAIAMNARGEEPTYPALLAAIPLALKNVEAGEMASKFTVYTILRKEC